MLDLIDGLVSRLRRAVVYRSWLSAVACGAMVAAASAAVADEPQPEPGGARGPRLTCDEPVYRFGEATSNQVIEHGFVIANAGDAPLRITGIRTSCGCTVAKLPKHEVPPGERTSIEASLALHGKRGTTRQRITVTSNDPVRPETELWFEGVATEGLAVVPERVLFGTVPQGEVVSREVTIRGAPVPPFRIVAIETYTPLFTAEELPSNDPLVHRLQLRTTAHPEEGLIDSSVRVQTDSRQHPELHIPISAHVVTGVTIAPQTIELSTEVRAPVTRYVAIRRGAGGSFRILDVATPDAAIQADVQPLGESGYRIRVSNLVASEALDDQRLHVRTDIPGIEEIDVPFRVVGGGD